MSKYPSTWVRLPHTGLVCVCVTSSQTPLIRQTAAGVTQAVIVDAFWLLHTQIYTPDAERILKVKHKTRLLLTDRGHDGSFLHLVF